SHGRRTVEGDPQGRALVRCRLSVVRCNRHGPEAKRGRLMPEVFCNEPRTTDNGPGRWFAVSRLPALGAALLAGLLLPVPTSSGCDDKPLNKGEVRVSVVAILASQTCTEIDWRLQCIAREVQKVHPELKLKGFRLAKMTCKPVPVRGSETFELAVDQTAAITVLRPANKENK